MKTLTISCDVNKIKGFTLEERAKLVLSTSGNTKVDIINAYRKLAKQYHPDAKCGNKEKFQVINEAYELLIKGNISKRPLLANDDLVIKVTNKQVAHLINYQKEWDEYDQWIKDKFYGIGVL